MRKEKERTLLNSLKPELKVVDDDALNAESYPALLDSSITTTAYFFVRNNGLLPEVPLDDWKLTIDGEVRRPQTLSVSDLQTSFERVTVSAVLECAGNGRACFTEPTEGIQWGRGAVGCARWSGVRLANILSSAGIKDTAVYTGHYSRDVLADGSGRLAISRGLPIAKALAPETIVAFEMNDEPLPYLHGGPLRIVAPGYPGSAWQKWLDRVQVLDREHDGEKMLGTDYRLPMIPIRPGEKVDERQFAVITDMPINSLITSPNENFSVRTNQFLHVRGFAWGGNAPVEAVDISGDGGITWQSAELAASCNRFAWRRFSTKIQLRGLGKTAVICRAMDEKGRCQPVAAPWNPRGYCNNSAHQVTGLVVE